MSLDAFVRERRPVWTHFAALVQRVYASGAKRLPGEALRELLVLYRDVSADLARLRAFEADPALIREINRLVTRAHGQIYRGAGRSQFGVMHFLLSTYPRLFRQCWRYSLASFAISLAATLMAYSTVQRQPDVIADILGGADTEFRGERTAEDIQGRFEGTPAAILSSSVTTNNIVVAFTAFALGITFGVGTVYVLVVNGAMLGGFAGAYARSGAAADFWSTVLTHGTLELSAIVVAGGAGLMMGYALWCPGARTRRRALREEAARAALLTFGLVPAFVIAGILEGFVTPRTDWPAELKLALGLSCAGVYWAYLLLGGRERAPRSSAGRSGLTAVGVPSTTGSD